MSKHNRERRNRKSQPAGVVATTAQAIRQHGETGLLFQAAMTEELNKGGQVPTATLCLHGSQKVSVTAHRGKAVVFKGIYLDVEEALAAAQAHLEFRRFCMVVLSKMTYRAPLDYWLVADPDSKEVYRLALGGGDPVEARSGVDYDDIAVAHLF
jgi:hypothetical protein